MSTLPTGNLVGPIVQSTVQQHQSSRSLETERRQQITAEQTTARKTEQTADAIGETENDTRVHADAEGGGSQGRTHDNPTPSPNQDPPTDQGIEEDEDGKLHVDLEA